MPVVHAKVVPLVRLGEDAKMGDVSGHDHRVESARPARHQCLRGEDDVHVQRAFADAHAEIGPAKLLGGRPYLRGPQKSGCAQREVEHRRLQIVEGAQRPHPVGSQKLAAHLVVGDLGDRKAPAAPQQVARPAMALQRRRGRCRVGEQAQHPGVQDKQRRARVYDVHGFLGRAAPGKSLRASARSRSSALTR